MVEVLPPKNFSHPGAPKIGKKYEFKIDVSRIKVSNEMLLFHSIWWNVISPFFYKKFPKKGAESFPFWPKTPQKKPKAPYNISYPKIDYDSWVLFTFGCNGGRWVSLGGPGWWLDLTFVILMNNLITLRLWIWNLWIRCRMNWSGPDIGSRTNSWRWSSAVLALASQIIFEMVCVLKLFITNPAKNNKIN